jgi:hypothetical protein
VFRDRPEALAGKALPFSGLAGINLIYNNDGDFRLVLGSAEVAGLGMAKVSGALLIGRLRAVLIHRRVRTQRPYGV